MTFGVAAALMTAAAVTGHAQPEHPSRPAAAAPAASAFPVFPIHVAVAEESGAPVVDQAWLDAQVAMANRIFAPVHISFELTGVRGMDDSHARLEDRADRHALGALMHEGVINWFAVKSLRDVDEPDRMRSGVHWRPAGHPGKHLVIVASHSVPDVLAHELGHFFGNRQHPDTPGNIMSYADPPPGTLPFFDATQRRRIERFARRFLESGEIRP